VSRLLQHADSDQALVLLGRSTGGEEQALALARALYPRHRKAFVDTVAEERENLRQFWGGLAPEERERYQGRTIGNGVDPLEEALRDVQDPLESPDFLRLIPEELLHCFIAKVDSEIGTLPDSSCSIYPIFRKELLPVTSLTARIWTGETPYEVAFDGEYGDAREHLSDSFDSTVLLPALQRFFANMARRYEQAPPATQTWFKDVLGRRFCRFLQPLPKPLEAVDMRRAWRTVPEQVRMLWSRQLLAEFGVAETCALPEWLPEEDFWFKLASSAIGDEHYRMIRRHPGWRTPLSAFQYPAAARALTAICHHLGAGSLVRELRSPLLTPLREERGIVTGNLIDWGQLRGLLDVEQVIPKALQPSLGTSTGKRPLRPRWHVGHYRTWGDVPPDELRNALLRMADLEGEPERRLRIHALEVLFSRNRALD